MELCGQLYTLLASEQEAGWAVELVWTILEEQISCPCQELNHRLSIHPAWYLVITLIIVLMPGHKVDLSLSSSPDVNTVWNRIATSHISSWYDV